MGQLISRSTKLKLRRLIRRRGRNTVESIQNASDQLDTNLFGRFNRLKKVRRFALGWIGLMVLMITITGAQIFGLTSAYQSSKPIAGGAYHEGMVGTFTTTNPLFASGSVDVALSRLIFSGLLRYDSDSNLSNDLAEDVSHDETGKVYTAKIRQGVLWHDNNPVTADDVVFTYQLAKNPDVKAQLLNGMRGIGVEKVDDYTVRFTLPNAHSTFPEMLTLGVLPQHLLKDTPPPSLRNSPFNTTSPIGSGPFKWHRLIIDSVSTGTDSVISLDKNHKYHDGSPELDRFVLHAFTTEDALRDAYANRRVRAMAGLQSVAREYDKDDTSSVLAFQSTAAVMVFFNTTSSGPVSDVKVRQALVNGTSRRDMLDDLDKSLRTVREPVLINQFAFDARYAQPRVDYSKAKTLLEEAGWRLGSDKMRTKDGKKLTFTLFAEETKDNQKIVNFLKKEWHEKLGIQVDATLQPSAYFQSTLQSRGYDAVLHGISIGADPDVYAYWHSSQADGIGMNFSNYKSTSADTALEAGRTRQDEAQRKVKYESFLKAWSADAPALALYRPKFYYVTRGPVYELKEHLINTDSDRYYTTQNWKIAVGFVNDY